MEGAGVLMVTQTLTKPTEGDIIYARKATSGAVASATWEAIVDICNELAGRSGTTAFEAGATFAGAVTITTGGLTISLTGLTISAGGATITGGTRIADYVEVTQVAAPSAPAAGKLRIYAKTDGTVVQLDSSGSESSLGGGGARAFLLMGA